MRNGASRRQLGAGFGAVLLTASIPSAKAAVRVRRIGWLDLSPSEPVGNWNQQRFHEGMRALGYAEGRDYVIEARFADTDFGRLPQLARELVDARVDIIVTVGTPTSVAAKAATSTIPIVMTGGNDPVARGLIASLGHPGGNVTGLAHSPGSDFSSKGFQLLQQAVPTITRVAVLTVLENPARAPEPAQPPAPDKSGLLRLLYDLNGISNVTQLNILLDKIVSDKANAAFIYPEFVVSKFSDEIASFLESSRLPAMVQARDLINRGGLLYYYADFAELRRKAATYVDKIIKGAKPADLPVEQPSKFEFIVNLRTARALGLTMPQSIIAFADQVIE